MPEIKIADKDTLDQIDVNVGTSTDTAASPTLFGRIRQIYEHLTAHWTSGRAGNLDRLDTTVSSRASAADWTPTRAANLDTTVSSRAAQSNVGVTGDTGGTASAGSLMAKSNAILTWFTGTWTAARAAFLDVAVSSRAAASTALSNATWTNARASYLDKLNAGMLTANSAVRSVQRGNVFSGSFFSPGGGLPIQATVSINAVSPTKCFVSLYGSAYVSGTSSINNIPRLISLTSNVLTIGIADANTFASATSPLPGNYAVSWEVVEFY